MSDFLSNIKTGDEVFVNSTYRYELEIVERVTKTQIVVRGETFRRKTGYSTNYSKVYLSEATEKAKHEYFVTSVQRAIANNLPKAIWKVEDLDKLKVIAEILGIDV